MPLDRVPGDEVILLKSMLPYQSCAAVGSVCLYVTLPDVLSYGTLVVHAQLLRSTQPMEYE